MTRAQLRRKDKADRTPEKTYTLKESQIVAIQREAAAKATKLLGEKTFIMMMALPLEVLITEDYWKKSAKKKIPKFIEDLLRVYEGYEKGQITLEEMEDDLLEFAKIKIGHNKEA